MAFIPDIQRNFLVHGGISAEFTEVPPNVQLVTFMEVGQFLSFDIAESVVFWLQNDAQALKQKNLKSKDAVKFNIETGKKPHVGSTEKGTVRTRIYNPGEACPNFHLKFKDPFKFSLGFYKTNSANLDLMKGNVDGRDMVLTNDFIDTIPGLQEGTPFRLRDVLTFLSTRGLTTGKKIRLYLIACSERIAGNEPRVVNMEEDEPPGGWGSFEGLFSEGGRRKRAHHTRRRKGRKMTRKHRRHTKK